MYLRYDKESGEWVKRKPESRRGCGWRRIGGLYLVGPPVWFACDRPPIPLVTCPVCGAGIRQSRGWTWIEPLRLFGPHGGECKDPERCSLCYPPEGRAGLLWVGRRYYSLAEFLKEAAEQGISKRIGGLPRGFKPGETVVYLAHPEAVKPANLFEANGDNGEEGKPRPGIFMAFRPRVEKVFPADDLPSKEEVERLLKRGIEPVAVPNEEKHRAGK